jgi:uncharacterized protein (TIGR02996 family)
MGDGLMLWQAVLDRPDDALVKRAFADWLEEDSEVGAACLVTVGRLALAPAPPVLAGMFAFTLRWMAYRQKHPRCLKTGRRRWRWYVNSGPKAHQLSAPFINYSSLCGGTYRTAFDAIFYLAVCLDKAKCSLHFD